MKDIKLLPPTSYEIFKNYKEDKTFKAWETRYGRLFTLRTQRG